MSELALQLHKEFDEEFTDLTELMQSFGLELIGDDLRYFAADVIADCYDGRYLKGLACACQCFMNARLIHTQEGAMQAERVLLGDYFIGRIADFDLPNDSGILEHFAAFVEEEVGNDSKEAFDTARYADLFRNVAKEMKERGL